MLIKIPTVVSEHLLMAQIQLNTTEAATKLEFQPSGTFIWPRNIKTLTAVKAVLIIKRTIRNLQKATLLWAFQRHLNMLLLRVVVSFPTMVRIPHLLNSNRNSNKD
jgi:hypothetical protein